MDCGRGSDAGAALRVPGLSGRTDVRDGGTRLLYWNPYRPAGCLILLRILHRLNRRLAFVVGVQHALGIGTALVLYRCTARYLSRSWIALIPACVTLYGGSQLFLEHSVMSEGPYVCFPNGAGAVPCGTRRRCAVVSMARRFRNGPRNVGHDAKRQHACVLPPVFYWICSLEVCL